MKEMVVTTEAIRHAKLRSNRRHQHTITQTFLQAGCPSCRPTNSVRVLKGTSITLHGLAHSHRNSVTTECTDTGWTGHVNKHNNLAIVEEIRQNAVVMPVT